jgi:hypothetical protein
VLARAARGRGGDVDREGRVMVRRSGEEDDGGDFYTVASHPKGRM